MESIFDILYRELSQIHDPDTEDPDEVFLKKKKKKGIWDIDAEKAGEELKPIKPKLPESYPFIKIDNLNPTPNDSMEIAETKAVPAVVIGWKTSF